MIICFQFLTHRLFTVWMQFRDCLSMNAIRILQNSRRALALILDRNFIRNRIADNTCKYFMVRILHYQHFHPCWPNFVRLPSIGWLVGVPGAGPGQLRETETCGPEATNLPPKFFCLGILGLVPSCNLAKISKFMKHAARCRKCTCSDLMRTLRRGPVATCGIAGPTDTTDTTYIVHTCLHAQTLTRPLPTTHNTTRTATTRTNESPRAPHQEQTDTHAITHN